MKTASNWSLGIIGLWRAIKIAHRLKDNPLPVKRDGYYSYYVASEDKDQKRYNFARSTIEQWPRIKRLLLRLNWV
jgi:hypothetical protein